MDERPVFAHGDVPLESRAEPFGFDEFLSRTAQLAHEIVSDLEQPDSAMDPMLVIAHLGDLFATAWGIVSPELEEHFLDRVVPWTLGSYDLSMAGLLTMSRLTRPTAEGSVEAQEAVVLCALDGSGDGPPHEAVFAAWVYRSPGAPPRLGMFTVFGDGRLPSPFAKALYEGFGLDSSDSN